MDEIKPAHYVTREECQEMIEKAIDRHNKNATLISAALGSILLLFYAHGLLTVIDKFK
jgi:predicted nucleic acid-binding Zn ribbon protein